MAAQRCATTCENEERPALGRDVSREGGEKVVFVRIESVFVDDVKESWLLDVTSDQELLVASMAFYG